MILICSRNINLLLYLMFGPDDVVQVACIEFDWVSTSDTTLDLVTFHMPLIS